MPASNSEAMCRATDRAPAVGKRCPLEPSITSEQAEGNEWILRIAFTRWQHGAIVFLDFGLLEVKQACRLSSVHLLCVCTSIRISAFECALMCALMCAFESASMFARPKSLPSSVRSPPPLTRCLAPCAAERDILHLGG